MKKAEPATFIEPSYERTRTGPKINGVQFYSYHTGIMSYAEISEDGQIMVRMANAHRDGAPTYFADVIGHGQIKGRGSQRKRFRSEQAALRAGVKTWREMND